MKTWLLSRWDALRGSFWFVPMLMVVGAGGLSFLTLMLDGAAARRGVDIALPWTFSRGPEGSRAILATVAGSVLTIASVCFSITIVALQQASSQFGPRLLHNFMRNRGNQLVLGTLIAAFTYCLLVLRSVNGTDAGRFVPHLSVTVGLLSGLAGVGVLIYFLHHAAASIQAERHRGRQPRTAHGPRPPVPGAVREGHAGGRGGPSRLARRVRGGGGRRDRGRERLPPDGRQRPGDGAGGRTRPGVDPGLPPRPVRVHRHPTGPRVAGGASDRRNHRRPALGVLPGTRRTLLQDAEFAIDQLVEIAVRALSPGINDPFTAVACVDRLGAGLADFAGRDVPSPNRVDAAGPLRVVANAVTPEGVAGSTFHQIRQAARGNAAVTLRLLEVIAAVAPRVRSAALRHALLTHAALIHEGGEATLAPADRAEADRRFQAARTALAEPATA